MAKSLAATLIGAAIREGRIHSPDGAVTSYLPVLAGSDWEGVTLQHVLTMSSGLGWRETFTDPAFDRHRPLEAQNSPAPGRAGGIKVDGLNNIGRRAT